MRVSDLEIEKMVRAIGVQLTRDVAPIWGQVPTVLFCHHGKSPAGIVCTISDEPDVEGAAGYHDEDESGVSYIKVFTFDGAPSLIGADALSVTLSHEILEVVGDAPANKWADGPDGFDYAYELCDAVEGDTYEIDGVSVSNFVHPEFFDPKSPKGTKLAQVDGTVSAPFTMSAGGYQIKRTEPGKISETFARHEPGSTHAVSERVVLVFGPKFPSRKREAKIARALRRRGSK